MGEEGVRGRKPGVQNVLSVSQRLHLFPDMLK